MIPAWLGGLVRVRPVRMAGAASGVGVTVALLASLGVFLADSAATMTKRTVAAVPIDWQVEAVPGADGGKIESAIREAAPIAATEMVNYATVEGFEAQSGGTVQTTGAGKVVGVGPSYAATFPKEIRMLSGSPNGVLVAQQTAANLHVVPGDSVTIRRIGLAPVQVKVAGVIDMPDADSFFQGVGLPPLAAPQAPPDNVLLMPAADWLRLFGPQAAQRPDTVRAQFHVRLDRAGLPSRPTDAYLTVAGQAKNLEVRVAGQALVANNLGARLDAVRGDALYATVLFLFLGLPGAALGEAMTVAIAAAGSAHRRQEQALLRLRGASDRQVLGFSLAETCAVALVGIGCGLAASVLLAGPAVVGSISLLPKIVTGALAALAGALLCAGAVLLPAFRGLRGESIARQRRMVGRATVPGWRRYYLDVLLLATSGLLFWQTASTGYQIVLAPEGVPATAVDYKAFISPALFWIGAALLTARIVGAVISRNGALLKALISPVAGGLAPVVGASLSTQARRLTAGILMTALAVAFGTSTAVFNATYRAQARVDAELTNGSDVTVFGTSATPAGSDEQRVATAGSVAAVRPMQHRFAYVGADLQDLYGIDPATIGAATSLSDAYFRGGNATQMLARLAATPDGVLVSEETVTDFQLVPGDAINLRLLSAKDNQYHPVPFRFIGVAREFPTAPRDSFLVANAAYVAQVTGNPGAEYLLTRVTGDPAAVADKVRAALSDRPGLQVKDISQASHIIGSSLTAVNMSGLARIEFAFALVMAAAAAGLMLALGFNDRRRDFAILTAIGARPRQLSAFLGAEGLLVVSGGIFFGTGTGFVAAWMLVKLLTGVFDPPPEALAVPIGYIALFLVLVAGSVLAAVAVARRGTPSDALVALKDI